VLVVARSRQFDVQDDPLIWHIGSDVHELTLIGSAVLIVLRSHAVRQTLLTRSHMQRESAWQVAALEYATEHCSWQEDKTVS
jgi:hypothetical protein